MLGKNKIRVLSPVNSTQDRDKISVAKDDVASSLMSKRTLTKINTSSLVIVFPTSRLDEGFVCLKRNICILERCEDEVGENII